MTTIHDLARIAATMRLAGELLDAHGHEAWRTTLEWQTGAKTASYNPDPTGQQSANCSTPPCPDCPHPVPSDPTGEAAIHRTPTHHRDLIRGVEAGYKAAVEIITRVNATNPALTVRPALQLDATVADDGWCVSCHRDDRHCEPISENYTSRKLCRWCGDFRGAHGFLPPVDILHDRHQGRRITKQRVDEAVRELARSNRKKRRNNAA